MCVYQAQAAGESEEVVMTTTSTITILLPCIPSPQHRRERATKLQEKVICFRFDIRILQGKRILQTVK